MARVTPAPRMTRSAPGGAVPRVGVFIETSTGAGRDMLVGIARFARENGQWALHLDPRAQIFDPNWMPLWLDGWRGSGIIARLQSPSLAAAVTAAGIPVVDVLGESQVSAGPSIVSPAFPTVLTDDQAIADLAAEHLLDRGFQHFAFIGVRGSGWSARRQRGFCRAVEIRGCACELLETESGLFSEESWDRFIDEAAERLKRWPRPIGVMLANDELGPQVTQACRLAGVAVPEEVAIVGVDNDQPLCQVCDPPLSSVHANHEEIGYRAAAALARLISAGNAWRAAAQSMPPVLVAPRKVVARQSSDISAIGDPVVASALTMIRRGACEGLQVADLAERLDVSRSVLQRRFRAAMGRSVHEEIIRAQLHRAQELLRDSSLTLRSVAERAGFNHQEYMGAVFKARLGVTPGEFRKASQS